MLYVCRYFFANISVSPLSQPEAIWQWLSQHWCCIDHPREEAACTGLRSTLQDWCYTVTRRLRVNVELGCLCLKTESETAVRNKYLGMMTFEAQHSPQMDHWHDTFQECPVSPWLQAAVPLPLLRSGRCWSCCRLCLFRPWSSPCCLGCVGLCWEHHRESWGEMVSLHDRNS